MPPVASQNESEEVAVDSRITASESISYWSGHPPTVNSMLGGYPQISRADLRGSTAFYAKLLRKHPPVASGKLVIGVDCGAGIGRITAGFLSTVCDVVDFVEPVEAFALELKKQPMEGKGSVGKGWVESLEDWTPEKDRYDLIWIQWCTVYLTDTQLVGCLKRCRDAINVPDGWIVVKENTSKSIKLGGDGKDVYDEDDSSVTRSEDKLLKLFDEAALNVLAQETQRGFPRSLGLFPVRTYALRPR